MTVKQFWNDPYQTNHDTRIATVDGQRIQVESTIFYAESGGQESDRGHIAGRRVLEARKDGRDIVYTLDDASGLAPGMPVSMQIDWPRRHALMRLHFAAELVLELVYQRFPGKEKIGAHIAADKARIDFLHPQSIAEELPALAGEVARIVAADLPIISAFSDEAAERRFWQIDGFARVPCGGTHLRRTGEVGAIRLKRKNIGQGKERIEIVFAAPGTAQAA
jgi:Ser-tRNA(Ala) deacylase AlaX